MHLTRMFVSVREQLMNDEIKLSRYLLTLDVAISHRRTDTKINKERHLPK